MRLTIYLAEGIPSISAKTHTITDIYDHFAYTEKNRFDKRNFQRYINSLLEKKFVEDRPEWIFSLLTYKKSNKSFLFFNTIFKSSVSHYLKHFMDNPKIPTQKGKNILFSLL